MVMKDNGDTTGLFNSAASVDPATGNRSYSGRDYLLPNVGRSNLAVLTGAQVSLHIFLERKLKLVVEGNKDTIHSERRKCYGDWRPVYG